MHPPKPESPRSANCQLLYFTSYSLTADGAVLAAITNAFSEHPEGASLARIDRATGQLEPIAVFPGPAMQAYPYFARPRSANPAEDYLFNGTTNPVPACIRRRGTCSSSGAARTAGASWTA